MSREAPVRFCEGPGVQFPRATRLIVCHRDLEVVQQCQTVLQAWLKGMGLELKPSKTRITHTLHAHAGQIGFDFLGFHIRQYPVGKYHTGKDTSGRPLGFKTHIKPSKDKVILHQRRLAKIVRGRRRVSQETLIRRLNPLIKGWSNYYRTVVSGAIFEKVDDVLYHLLRRWANRRHPNQGRRWIAKKYWHFPPWTFAGIRPWLAMLIQRQHGPCAACGLYFLPGDLVEVHHQDGDHQNATLGNLAALHRHCHDTVHGPSQLKPKEGIHDKDWPFEEPYERESLTYGSEDQHAG